MSLQEYAAQFDGLEAGGFFNHSMASCGFGQVHDRAERFASYVRGAEALAHYDDLKERAKPDCPQCHGNGYLPIFRMGNNGYAETCPCVYEHREEPV